MPPAPLIAPNPKPYTLNPEPHACAGSLATAAYGTALGVIRALHSQGSLEHAFCTETRPYNQGDPHPWGLGPGI